VKSGAWETEPCFFTSKRVNFGYKYSEGNDHSLKGDVMNIKAKAFEVVNSSTSQRVLHPLAKQTRTRMVPGAAGTFGKSGYVRTAWKNKTVIVEFATEVVVTTAIVLAINEGLERLGVYGSK
jgi:hypothetical protein